jgi:ribosomal protein S18 acetylase RimI-like enzyme
MNIVITKANIDDIASMVYLSAQKRAAYEIAQSQFWRKAKDADENQVKWFEALLNQDDHILLVAKKDKKICGFVIGKIMQAPDVYDPEGLTLMIDDFCVKNNLWQEIGSALFEHLTILAKEHGCSQAVVVCGNHDEDKKRFLRNLNLSIASQWWVGKIN